MFGIYSELARRCDHHCGLNDELVCRAVSGFRAAHVPPRRFWSHRDETSRDVPEQA
jgi:hypothetical protein